MFTGVVKLAQVDDYINPGQDCIQPKIMKHAKQPEKATVSLNDCLACSGCITSAQSVLIQQMSVAKLLSLINQNKQRPVIVMLAPQVVIALAHKYQASPQRVYFTLSNFFKVRLGVTMVLDLWQGIQVCHQLVFQELSSRKQKTLIGSQCPGWVCYAEKTLTDQIVKLMSKVKSPQQILARLIKQKIPDSLIVTIMPCYDKKLEAIRFQVEKDVKQVDITITTVEFLDLYQNVSLCDFQPIQEESLNIIVDRFIFKQISLCFLQDQAANGYIQFLMNRLGGHEIKRIQIKNSDFVQYQAQVEGKVIKMAKCYGFRNIQRVVQQIKKNKCQYLYVQMMACPGACFSGGGQPKINNTKPKEVLENMNKIASTLSRQNLPQDRKIPLNINKFIAEYKVIEQTLTQAVMNW